MMPEPKTSVYRMADRLAGGRLAEELKRLQAARVPHTAIERILRNDYGIEVTAETLRVWTHELGIEDAEPVAEATA